MTANFGKVVALCGGIGGAKLAHGLSKVLAASDLTVIVNTGDDFQHLGLWISPDIDTVTYTMADRANPETGWGRAQETFRFKDALAELGGPDWFSLGDTDLATKAYRTQRMGEKARLTDVTLEIARALGVSSQIMPMTDDPIPTMVETDEGRMTFQTYFVRHKWKPKVISIDLAAARTASVTAEAHKALSDPDLAAIIICPSNPLLSIDPMLSIPGVRDILAQSSAYKVAVSPLVDGLAIKGPLSKILGEIGINSTPQSIATHYDGLIDCFVFDERDRAQPVTGVDIALCQTIMSNVADRVALARDLIALATSRRAARP